MSGRCPTCGATAAVQDDTAMARARKLVTVRRASDRAWTVEIRDLGHRFSSYTTSEAGAERVAETIRAGLAAQLRAFAASAAEGEA